MLEFKQLFVFLCTHNATATLTSHPADPLRTPHPHPHLCESMALSSRLKLWEKKGEMSFSGNC
ncbi:hypothetical protein PAMP_012892 [Pampus punctatissimus]